MFEGHCFFSFKVVNFVNQQKSCIYAISQKTLNFKSLQIKQNKSSQTFCLLDY